MDKILQVLKIRTRMLLLAGGVLAGSIVLGIIGISGLGTMEKILGSNYYDNLIPLNRISELESHILRINLRMADALEGTGETRSEHAGRTQEVFEGNDQLLSEYAEGIIHEEERILYEGLLTLHEQYRNSVEEAFEVLIASDDAFTSDYITNHLMNEGIEPEVAIDRVIRNVVADEDASYAIRNARAVGRELQGVIGEIISFNEASAELSYIEGYDVSNNLRLNVIIVFIIVFIIGITASFLITKSITKPINVLKTKISRMASGDLTVEVPIGYKAEFGEMFKSFQDMINSLGMLINKAKETSSDVHYSSDKVINALEDVRENVAIIDGDVQLLATGVENQVASLKESAAAMDNIASGIQQIAKSSTSVAELATETSAQANDGSVVIEKSVTQMETINQVVEDTSNVVNRFVTRTKTIDEALKAITGIAEQTNLLALNASIEAARAGEQGRGFAVVADEVSKLAAQSKESANEINVLLQEINDDTKEAVRAMEQGKIESEQGIKVIQQAGQAFTSIVEQVNVMTDQIQEVSATVEEIASGTEEVNVSIAGVVQTSEGVSKQARKVSDQNNSEVEMLDKMFASVDDTKNNVEKLEEDLNEFKAK